METMKKLVAFLVGILVLLSTIAATCAEEESATNPPEVGETPAVQTGWTTEQQEQFRTAFLAGEKRGLLPALVAYANTISENELICVIDALNEQYPNDADKIIAEMWIDTIPDDTPGVDDTISDVVFFAWDEC